MLVGFFENQLLRLFPFDISLNLLLCERCTIFEVGHKTCNVFEIPNEKFEYCSNDKWCQISITSIFGTFMVLLTRR